MTLQELGLVLTVVVTLGVVLAIILFERPRARQIEKDLREQAQRRAERPGEGRRED